MDKDRIKNIIIVVLVLIIVGGGCFFTSLLASNKDDGSVSSEDDATDLVALQQRAEEESALVSAEERKAFTEVSVEEYLTIYEGADSQLVFVGKPSCPYCEIVQPILENLAYQYDLTIYYVNIDNFSGDDQVNFVQSNDYFKNFGTPTLLIVSNSEIVETLEGLTDTESYTSFLQTNGFIPS